jgi:hypothetical protein
MCKGRHEPCNGQMWKLGLQATVARMSSLFSTHRPATHRQEASSGTEVQLSATRVQPWGLLGRTQETLDCRQETLAGTRARSGRTRVTWEPLAGLPIGTRLQAPQVPHPQGDFARPTGAEREQPMQERERATLAEPTQGVSMQVPQPTRRRLQVVPMQVARSAQQDCIAQVAPAPTHP